MDCSLPGSSLCGDFSGDNTGVDCHFSPAGDLPNPGIKPMFPGFLALQVDSLSAEPSVQFSSFAQSCLTLCDLMNHSMPGFSVHHQLLEFTQTHVHRVGDNRLTISSSIIPFSSCPQSFPASGSFPVSQLFASGGQSIGVSASASVLPMNTQD